MPISKIFDLPSGALQHYKPFWDTYIRKSSFWERSWGALQHYRQFLNASTKILAMLSMSTTALQAVLICLYRKSSIWSKSWKITLAESIMCLFPCFESPWFSLSSSEHSKDLQFPLQFNIVNQAIDSSFRTAYIKNTQAKLVSSYFITS